MPGLSPISVPSRPGSRATAAAGLIAGALALASCAQQVGYYPAKGDVKPHPNVARAQTLPIHGIDVSRWQGRIDWAAVRAAGTQFAFIKATEGGDHIDPRFSENWYGAARAGVPRGAYHFMYWCRPADQQASWFRRSVPSDPTALPPVLDLEWNGHSRTCPRKLPRETALAEVKLMLREMEAHTGKRPIIYTDITFHRDVLEGELHDYPHWVRSVAAEPHERYRNRQWTLWQYTTTGRVPGIGGDVDRNAFYGSAADWAKFLATDCDPRQHHRLAAQSACNGK
jgi:lysozyme